MKRYALGGIAGLIATILMTIVLAVARRMDLLQTPPPEQITANAVRHADASPDKGTPGWAAGWLAAHFCFGTGWGVITAGIIRFLPRSSLAGGSILGIFIWLFNYCGILPALHLYPAPQDDTRSRRLVMIVGHLVYGISLVSIIHRLFNTDRRQVNACRLDHRHACCIALDGIENA